jgi:hypothetical protein
MPCGVVAGLSFFVGDIRVKLRFVIDLAFQDARCIMSESVNLLMLSFFPGSPAGAEHTTKPWKRQSHCPRQTIWEDAMIDGYIELNRQGTV